MRLKLCFAAVASLLLFTNGAFAMDCSSSATDRSDYVSAALMKALDAGKGTNGSYPAWVERYMRDADLFGEALSTFCAKSPNSSFENAFAEVAQLKR